MGFAQALSMCLCRLLNTLQKNDGGTMNELIIQELKSIVGEQNVSEARADRITHSYDASREHYLPDAVVYASSVDEVSRILQFANQRNIPVLPRGAGSGFSGGSLPVKGGIVLVLTRMNKILKIDTDNMIAIVEPGVVTAELQREVEKRGLFYPPDPASMAYSTLGGNVAECAGGPRCLKYGVTKDYVLGLEAVLPSGEIIRTGGMTMKNVVGYDLTKLIVGSEGTLCVITKIIFKLIPKPEAKKTMLVQFPTIDSAAQAVASIVRAKIIPTTLEFMDKATINCIRAKSPLPISDQCQAILIIEVDGDAMSLPGQIERIRAVLDPLGVLHTEVAATLEESERIWQVRRSVSPATRKIAPDKFAEDIVVPRSKVPDMIRALETISSRYGVKIVSFGHAGDGNIHVSVMLDLNEEGMKETIELVLDEIFQTAIELDGSISGEHGIGTAKSKYMTKELNAATISAMLSIKQALDPNGILNAGKMFPTLSPEGTSSGPEGVR